MRNVLHSELHERVEAAGNGRSSILIPAVVVHLLLVHFLGTIVCSKVFKEGGAAI